MKTNNREPFSNKDLNLIADLVNMRIDDLTKLSSSMSSISFDRQSEQLRILISTIDEFLTGNEAKYKLIVEGINALEDLLNMGNNPTLIAEPEIDFVNYIKLSINSQPVPNSNMKLIQVSEVILEFNENSTLRNFLESNFGEDLYASFFRKNRDFTETDLFHRRYVSDHELGIYKKSFVISQDLKNATKATLIPMGYEETGMQDAIILACSLIKLAKNAGLDLAKPVSDWNLESNKIPKEIIELLKILKTDGFIPDVKYIDVLNSERKLIRYDNESILSISNPKEQEGTVLLRPFDYLRKYPRIA